MLNLATSQDFEQELATYSYMASVLSEWIIAEKMQDSLSAIDVLLWWSRSDAAEA
jgi:hypothetical protein